MVIVEERKRTAMNDDTIKTIFNEQGLEGLIKAVKDYNSANYWKAYRDGYIHGQGIGYQDGKYKGYAKAVQTIMKGRY